MAQKFTCVLIRNVCSKYRIARATLVSLFLTFRDVRRTKISLQSLIKLHFYACDPLFRRLAHLIWRGPFAPNGYFFHHLMFAHFLLDLSQPPRFFFFARSYHSLLAAREIEMETCENKLCTFWLLHASQWTRQPTFCARLRFFRWKYFSLRKAYSEFPLWSLTRPFNEHLIDKKCVYCHVGFTVAYVLHTRKPKNNNRSDIK